MRNIHHLLIRALCLALAFMALPLRAQFSEVRPLPQHISNALEPFAEKTRHWSLVADEARRASFAVEACVEGLASQGCEAAFYASASSATSASCTLTLGVAGDRCVSRWARRVPRRPEAYWLQSSADGVTVVGADERGLYYGVQTLLQAMEQGRRPLGTVTDWPDVPLRGTVEGFYGTPWSHEARLRQIHFYGRHKLNLYIYGPKDDPYHRHHWRQPYPEAEAQRLKALNDYARRHGVRFCWAIHPGVDIRWDEADRQALLQKLESVYALGVRSFAVFFDDISGPGANADRQTEWLNMVNRRFIRRHHDIEPLAMCPTVYNKAWTDSADTYLRTLGRRLDKDIRVMWTGNAVVADIDRPSMQWINQRIGREALVWWNFPVSDYVLDRILLGPAYGNGTDIAPLVSGFVSNPMEHAEASKIALYGIADYTWNMKAYDANADWLRALRELMPHCAELLALFAMNCQDLGPNGHGYRRDEGQELLPVARRALDHDAQAIRQLALYCRNLRMSADVLLADTTARLLVDELRPWLMQARLVADYGGVVCRMAVQPGATADTDTLSALNPFAAEASLPQLYLQARALLGEMDALAHSAVLHPRQPGIKVGTRVLLPTLHALFAQSVTAYNEQCGTRLDAVAVPAPYQWHSTVPQMLRLAVGTKGNAVTVAMPNEVVHWAPGASVCLQADRNVVFSRLAILSDAPVWKDATDEGLPAPLPLQLDLFTNGQWRTVPLSAQTAQGVLTLTAPAIGQAKASRLRLTNVSGQGVDIRMQAFTVEVK